MIRATLLCAVTLLLAGCNKGLEYADGTPTTYDEWKGRWVLVNYWAEWCAPCREEIPELNALAHAHADRVLIIGVNFDGVLGLPLTDLIVRMGIEFPVLTIDPRERWQYDRPSVLPTTIVIDPSGNVVRTLTGPQTRSTLARILDLQD